jgi:hypothetical protein
MATNYLFIDTTDSPISVTVYGGTPNNVLEQGSYSFDLVQVNDTALADISGPYGDDELAVDQYFVFYNGSTFQLQEDTDLMLATYDSSVFYTFGLPATSCQLFRRLSGPPKIRPYNDAETLEETTSFDPVYLFNYYTDTTNNTTTFYLLYL